jgi:hypothetical protein
LPLKEESATGIIGCANDGHEWEQPSPRSLDWMAQAGATMGGEADGGAILCGEQLQKEK